VARGDMSATAPTWADVVNSLQNALIGVLKGIADQLASNASTIASVVVGVGIAYAMYRAASRLVPLVGQIFGGLRL